MSAPSSAKPWLSWPHELPSMAECRATPEYARLFDQQRIREMHTEIRANVFAAAKKHLNAPKHSVILLMGGQTTDWDLYDTDVSKADFRQEAFFQYVFGVNEPDLFGLLDLDTQESVLFVPETTDESERWLGTRRPLSYHTERYGVSETVLTKDLDATLQKRGVQNLFTLWGQNDDSDAWTKTAPKFDGKEKYTEEKTKLHPMLVELRVFKTEREIEVLRLSNLISSQAHVYVMRHIHAGLAEIQLEGLYKAWCAFHGGTRHCAYTVSELTSGGHEKRQTSCNRPDASVCAVLIFCLVVSSRFSSPVHLRCRSERCDSSLRPRRSAERAHPGRR